MRRGSWVRELMRRAMIPALLVSFGACASPQSQDDPGARADSPELAPRVWVEQLAGPFRFEGGVLRSESGEPFRIAIASGSLEARVQESWPGGLFWSSGSSHAAGGLSGQHMRAVEGELSAAQILEELNFFGRQNQVPSSFFLRIVKFPDLYDAWSSFFDFSSSVNR